MTEAFQTDHHSEAENTYEEPEDASLRVHLGLRPIHYGDQRDTKGTHPDQRPCPSWCWVGKDPEYDHEIAHAHPMTATHSLGVTPSIVASQYVAHRSGEHVVAATIELGMEQRGTDSPRIAVHLRRDQFTDEGREHRFDEVLALSLTDAEELATVLQFLVKTAES